MAKLEADLIPLSDFVSVEVPGTPDTKMSIKSFIESKGLQFAKGLGFYQLSKPETIQLDKRILVQRLSDPSKMITGKAVRAVLKIDEAKHKKGGKFMIEEEILAEFKVFVQSTSYNRNLVGGTTFLYQKEKKDGNQPTPTTTTATSEEDGPTSPKLSRIDSSSSTTPLISSGGSNKVEVVISFDTTGSMYPCLSTVRNVIRETLTRLTTEIPSIKIGIIAHGDYDTHYIVSAANDYKLCGSNQVSDLIDFVTNARPTGGSTYPECYEFVMRQTWSKFDWSTDASKSLIMIGDATPHHVFDNPHKIDWRQEAKILKEKGIKIYSVQALEQGTDSFWSEIAKITMGIHLRLHQFSSIADFLVAVCFREGDTAEQSTTDGHLTKFECEISSSGRMVNNLRQLFDQLQGRVPVPVTTTTNSTGGDGKLVPVSPSRFQVLTVDEDQAIKQFAEARGLVFKAGRGFYEFTKPESVSDRKEVVLMDKSSGDFYTGWNAAREFSGIDPGKPNVKQQPKSSDKYIVFIQSTSYNRKLIKGQRFLYEVDMAQ